MYLLKVAANQLPVSICDCWPTKLEANWLGTDIEAKWLVILGCANKGMPAGFDTRAFLGAPKLPALPAQLQPPSSRCLARANRQL